MGLIDDLDQLLDSQKAEGSRQNQARAAENSNSQECNTRLPQGSSHQGRYETWTLTQLQGEVARYGFRPTQTRKNLLAQLCQVEEALRIQEQQQQQQQQLEGAEIGDVSIASTSSSFLHYSSMDLTSDADSTCEFPVNVIRQTKDTLIQRDDPEGEDQQQSQTRTPNEEERREERDDGDDDDEFDDDDEGFSQNEVDRVIAEAERDAAKTTSSSPNDIAPSLSNQLYKAITSDVPLYHRILLFEPVSFDEVSSTAKRAGVVGLRSKEVLRNWLDMQGICFYSAELTGQRQRY
ncbi:hypothetical protein CBS101457_000547 [Exobasidium rhododendri]|nr:hypothetical protein CBS101457_000547 [Exobasidium rhododendri]